MKRKIYYCFTILILLIIIISGCISSQPKTVPIPTVAQLPTAITSNSPIIKIISYPNNVKEGTNFTIRWEVSGGTIGNISHTAVHWGYKTGGENIKDYGRFSQVLTGNAPQQFSVELLAPSSGPIYFRAHSVVDDIDVYTPEYTITIDRD